jgi:adenine-specific DNA-methyltransferase
MSLNVAELGQVFTPCFIVADMINLIKNQGNILEPSAGDGAFAKKLNNNSLTSIEFDEKLANTNNFINIDFFDFDVNKKFDTIIGNPPYVRYQDINTSTKKLLQTSIFNKNNIDYSIFDNRSNLFLFFIYKSILHLKENGELIFITPRDFLKATSAIKLNEFIYQQGTITDIVELGDRKIFKNAQPNTIIWRFEKDNFSRTTTIKKNFILNKGQLLFTKNRYSINFSDIAFVKVGAVSGADKYFENENGIDFVCSYTKKTKKTKKMLYNQKHRDLEKFKNDLLLRKIKNFDENNWWQWGRAYYKSNEKRIYVNNKTRQKNPFFISPFKAYDGSILAIFPKGNLSDIRLQNLCDDLNKVNWKELGFVVDGRFIFSQKSLENTLLAKNFSKYIDDNKNNIEIIA